MYGSSQGNYRLFLLLCYQKITKITHFCCLKCDLKWVLRRRRVVWRRQQTHAHKEYWLGGAQPTIRNAYQLTPFSQYNIDPLSRDDSACFIYTLGLFLLLFPTHSRLTLLISGSDAVWRVRETKGRLEKLAICMCFELRKWRCSIRVIFETPTFLCWQNELRRTLSTF